MRMNLIDGKTRTLSGKYLASFSICVKRLEPGPKRTQKSGWQSLEKSSTLNTKIQRKKGKKL